MLPSSEERSGIPEICYYKYFKPAHPFLDPQYYTRCPRCNGVPKEECTKYTTKSHVDEFYKLFGGLNPDAPISKEDKYQHLYEQPEPAKTLDDIDRWKGGSTIGN